MQTDPKEALPPSSSETTTASHALLNAAQAHGVLITEQQAQRLKMLNKITRIALQSSSLKEMLDEVARALIEMLPACGCYVTLWDERQGLAAPFAAYGEDMETFLAFEPMPGEPSLSRLVLERGSALYTNNFRQYISKRLPIGEKFSAVFALPLRLGEQKLGAVILACKNPSPLITEADIAAWEEVAQQLSLAAAKAKAFEQEQRRRQEAEILQQAVTAISGSLNLQQVLDSVLSYLSKVIPVNYSMALLLDEGNLRIAAIGGSNPRLSPYLNMYVRRDQGFHQLLADANEPVVLNDVQSHPIYALVRQHIPDVKSWMGIPLFAFGAQVGYLTLGSVTKNAFTGVEVHQARIFAHQAAVAIENARLFEQIHQGRERLQQVSKRLVEVQEAERRMLASELHDEIGQSLTAMMYTLETSKRLKDRDLENALSEMQDLVRQLMNQVRELSLDLRPSLLDHLGIKAALEWFFKRYQSQTGIAVAFQHENIDRRFDTDIETAAFRIVQEALTNAARYAEVKEVFVQAFFTDQLLRVQVWDEGRGFDLNIIQNHKHTFGIDGMYERASLVGGSFEIDSKPGSGTQISAVFPVEGHLERRRHERKSPSGG